MVVGAESAAAIHPSTVARFSAIQSAASRPIRSPVKLPAISVASDASTTGSLTTSKSFLAAGFASSQAALAVTWMSA